MSNIKELPAPAPHPQGGKDKEGGAGIAEQQAGRRMASRPQTEDPLDDGVASLGDALKAMLKRL